MALMIRLIIFVLVGAIPAASQTSQVQCEIIDDRKFEADFTTASLWFGLDGKTCVSRRKTPSAGIAGASLYVQIPALRAPQVGFLTYGMVNTRYRFFDNEVAQPAVPGYELERVRFELVSDEPMQNGNRKRTWSIEFNLVQIEFKGTFTARVELTGHIHLLSASFERLPVAVPAPQSELSGSMTLAALSQATIGKAHPETIAEFHTVFAQVSKHLDRRAFKNQEWLDRILACDPNSPDYFDKCDYLRVLLQNRTVLACMDAAEVARLKAESAATRDVTVDDIGYAILETMILGMGRLTGAPMPDGTRNKCGRLQTVTVKLP